MLDAIYLIWCLQIAVLAWVVTVPLFDEGMIFEWYYDLLENLNSVFPMLAKPLGLCEKCFAGQLAFWVWLFYFKNEYTVDILNAVLRHSLFVSITIFFVILIKIFMQKWK